MMLVANLSSSVDPAVQYTVCVCVCDSSVTLCVCDSCVTVCLQLPVRMRWRKFMIVLNIINH